MEITREQLQSVAAYMNHLEKRVAYNKDEPEKRKPYSTRLLGAMRVLRELGLLDEFEILADAEDVDTWIVKEGE